MRKYEVVFIIRPMEEEATNAVIEKFSNLIVANGGTIDGPIVQRGGDFVRKYEVVFIIRPMEEEATNAVIEKFSNLIVANGGTIDKEDRWGKKRLAYEIKD